MVLNPLFFFFVVTNSCVCCVCVCVVCLCWMCLGILFMYVPVCSVDIIHVYMYGGGFVLLIECRL